MEIFCNSQFLGETPLVIKVNFVSTQAQNSSFTFFRQINIFRMEVFLYSLPSVFKFRFLVIQFNFVVYSFLYFC